MTNDAFAREFKKILDEAGVTMDEVVRGITVKEVIRRREALAEVESPYDPQESAGYP